MIGVFDSGYGGLTILKAIIAKLPDYSYVYFGDNAKSPYGSRSAEEITELTWQGVEYLFEQACPLVILGCNTASAVALRPIQQDILPKKYPDRRVLGIVVPTIEQITGVEYSKGSGTFSLEYLTPSSEFLTPSPNTLVGILGTEQTIKSQAYVEEIHKRNPSVTVVQQSCPELVPLIEAGAPTKQIQPVIEHCIKQLFAQNSAISSVVLACTHYALIEELIRTALPANVQLFDQPTVVAESLAKYLTRHPEIETRVARTAQRHFVTTGDPIEVSRLSTHYFGQPIEFSKA